MTENTQALFSEKNTFTNHQSSHQKLETTVTYVEESFSLG